MIPRWGTPWKDLYKGSPILNLGAALASWFHFFAVSKILLIFAMASSPLRWFPLFVYVKWRLKQCNFGKFTPREHLSPHAWMEQSGTYFKTLWPLAADSRLWYLTKICCNALRLACAFGDDPNTYSWLRPVVLHSSGRVFFVLSLVEFCCLNPLSPTLFCSTSGCGDASFDVWGWNSAATAGYLIMATVSKSWLQIFLLMYLT